jgi:broad specificity phosphatase PhoE
VRIVLARHGESVFSACGALNGDTTVPGGLTIAGLGQARALGTALADEAFELCVTTELQRTVETADEVIRGRDIPRLVVPELNDPRYGRYEGAQIDDYRAWAGAASSADSPGERGESRFEIISRYAFAFRALLERPESSILVVAHSLPIAYAVAAGESKPPRATMPLVPYATPYRFLAGELDVAAAVLERWTASPTW